MFQLGRTTQVAGLIILPLAVTLELVRAVTLRQSLILSALGVVLYTLGYFIAAVAKRR